MTLGNGERAMRRAVARTETQPRLPAPGAEPARGVGFALLDVQGRPDAPDEAWHHEDRARDTEQQRDGPRGHRPADNRIRALQADFHVVLEGQQLEHTSDDAL